jgi:hypothetical protein
LHQVHPFAKSTMLCYFFINTCVIHMLIIMHKQANLTRAMIHLRTHDHHVVEGKCKNFMKQVKLLVQEEVYHSMSTTPSIVSLIVGEVFLSKHLLNE